MTVVTALCDCSALLLVVSGPAKLRQPHATVGMLSELGLPGWSRLPQGAVVRLIGAAELAVAGYLLAIGGVLSAVLLALVYLCFVFVAVRLLRSASTVDCGCFGAASAPISRAHVAVTAAGAAVAITAILAPVGPVSSLFTTDPLLGSVTALLVLALAGAGYLTITALPALLRARAS